MRQKIACAISLVILAAAATSPSAAQSTFTVMNGFDTVAVERFTANASSLTGDLGLMQGPRWIHVNYQLTLRPDGSTSRAKTVDDSPSMFSGVIAFNNDAMLAARADPANKGAALRMGPPNSFPTIGTSIAMMEQLVRATQPAPGGPATVHFINIRNGGDGELTIRRISPDSVVIVCVGCMRANAREELRLAVRANGDVTGGSNPGLNWTITRDDAASPASAAPCPIAPAGNAAAIAKPPAAHAAGSTPERTFGPPTAIASEPFWNIASVRELSDGRLLVVQRGPMNGMMRSVMSNALDALNGRCGGSGRGAAAINSAFLGGPESPAARIVLFDAKLAHATPIGHAGSGPSEYQQPEMLYAAPADTTLVLDNGRSDMLVIDPTGKFVATKPVPGGNSALMAVGGVALDRNGRLLYAPREVVSRQTAAGMESGSPDSIAIIAFDPNTGSTIPVAHVRVMGTTILIDANPAAPGKMIARSKSVPFPIIDDWVVMPDGTLAIIRGTDLHIDWIAPDGKIRSTPPIPYARRAVTDSDKAAFIDAARSADAMMKSMPASAMMTITRLDPDSFPRFKPPFASRGAKAASDGTIWLPSKTISPGSPDGYYVIGPDGKIREIVHFPPGERLIGFGKGVAYVAYNDSRVARVPLH
jgi:hypothetical protein